LVERHERNESASVFTDARPIAVDVVSVDTDVTIVGDVEIKIGFSTRREFFSRAQDVERNVFFSEKSEIFHPKIKRL
jgi:hypothetical protein